MRDRFVVFVFLLLNVDEHCNSFADMAGKSLEYCRATADLPHGLMLLNEVLLGDSYEVKRAQYVEPSALQILSKHSVAALGNTAPQGAIAVDDALDDKAPLRNQNTSQVPLFDVSNGADSTAMTALCAGGPLRKVHSDCELDYNEFVVFDAAQVQQRYLLQLEFTQFAEK